MTSNASPKPYNIVVGIDFGTAGDDALDRATHIAHHIPESRLFLIHVVDDHAAGICSSEELAEVTNLVGSIPSRLAAYAAKRVALTGLLNDADLEVAVRTGSPVTELAEYAREVNADLIVIGGSRDGIDALLLGSVAEKLIDLAECPVIVARTEGATAEGEASLDVPKIEPACEDCLEARARTKGAEWWCAFHAKPKIHAHAYGYDESLSYATHDSEVIPTGAARRVS